MFFEFIQNFFHLLLLIAPYLLFGLILAGFFHSYIPEKTIQKYLSGNSMKTVFNAALLGLPLPLCSCSVLPMAKTLKKQGAGDGAVTGFLITTPMSGIDSIIATYGVFGWPIAIIRTLATLLLGMIAGFLTLKFTSKAVPTPHFTPEPPKDEESCCCHGGCEAPLNQDNKFKESFHYAFGDLLPDIAKAFILALLVSALFITLIPQEFLKTLQDNLLLSYLVILLIGVPVYTCSISAIPFAATLYFIGFSPGAVFLYLIAAPATNIITLNIIRTFLPNKAVIIYLLTIIFGSVLFALGIDLLVDQLSLIDVDTHNMQGYHWVEVLLTIIFSGLLLRSLLRK